MMLQLDCSDLIVSHARIDYGLTLEDTAKLPIAEDVVFPALDVVFQSVALG
jgi:hypothetical protein